MLLPLHKNVLSFTFKGSFLTFPEANKAGEDTLVSQEFLITNGELLKFLFLPFHQLVGSRLGTMPQCQVMDGGPHKNVEM